MATSKLKLPPGAPGTPKGRRAAGLSNLRAAADMLRVAAGTFLAFQDSDASAAYDVEEAMDMTPEERTAAIKDLEKVLREMQAELDRLNRDPQNELTAKSIEHVIADIERRLFALKAAQAVANAYPAVEGSVDWRLALNDAITRGQLEGIDLIIMILSIPVGPGAIRGVSRIRSIRGFFSWLYRSRPLTGTPKKPIPWNEYMAGYADRLAAVRRRGRDPFAVQRALAKLQEWIDGHTPFVPPPP
jgi:hypothetical protein